VRSFFDRKFANQSMLPLFEGINYELRKCSDCGLIYQGSILTDDYLVKLYDDWLVNDDAEVELTRDGLGPDPHKAIYYANELLMLARHLKRPPCQISILDYGAGRGWWCRMASALGFDVTGTDLSESRLSDLHLSGIRTANINSLPRETYDFVNTEQVFEHLAKPFEVLRYLHAALKPAGIIKISVPEGRGVEERLDQMGWTAPRGTRNFIMPATPLIHINTFTSEAIVAMGRRAGFSRVQIPLRLNYSVIDGRSLRELMKSVVRPVYRRISKATYVFLQPTH
jgi:SAM-dependent methyltransferase